MPRREDHEVHKGHVVGIGGGEVMLRLLTEKHGMVCIFNSFARNYVFVSDYGKRRERRQLDGVGIDEMIRKRILERAVMNELNWHLVRFSRRLS